MARVGRLAALFLLVLPVAAAAACRIETTELPVRMVGPRAVATVGIDGKTVPLIVDSGAAFSILTEAAASQLDLRSRAGDTVRLIGLTGRIDARVVVVDKLQLLHGELSRVAFAVGGNDPGAGTMGFMGRNLLARTDTEYDLAHGAVRFADPEGDCARADLAYWAGKAPVTELDLEPDDRRSPTPALRARVRVNGAELVALFDTGAAMTVVGLQAARRAGIGDEGMTPTLPIFGGGRGSLKSWTAVFERFEIGGEVVSNNRLRIGDFALDEADLLLGVDFFLSHRIYVSRKLRKMFITYNGGDVFALNRSDRAELPPQLSAPEAGDAAAALGADQLARRGAASAARGDSERALADLDRAVALEPTSAAHFAQRGAILQAMRQPAKAAADFDRALELDSSQHEARGRRAVLRLMAQDRDGALGDLDALDKALAPQAWARLTLARLYMQLERPAQSLAQLNQWLPAHPDQEGHESALNNRCWARALLGVELDEALVDCNQAIAGAAQNAAFLDSRGWVLLRLGRDAGALADFDRALALRPGIAWSLYGRGLAKTRLGDAAGGDADLAAARQVQADVDARIARAGLIGAASASRR